MRTIRSFIERNLRTVELIPAFLIGMVFIWIHASTHPWNSDHLYFEAILRDLLSGIAALREFHFSASTFFFPDSLIYLPLRLLTDNLGWVFLLFMIIQFSGLLLLIQHLAGQRGNSLFYCVSTLAFFGLLDSQWFSILYPVHHGGQWIWGILLISKLDPLRSGGRAAMINSSLLVSALVSSDLLFGFTGVGPYVLWSTWSAWRGRDWRRIRSIGIWGAATVLGILAAYFLFRWGTGSYFGWNKPLPGLILDRARSFVRDFFSLKSSIWMVLSFFYLIRIRKEPAGLLAHSAGLSIAAVVGTGVWASPENVRYIQPVSVAFVWAAGHWVTGLTSRVIRASIFVGLVILGLSQAESASRKFLQNPWAPPYLPSHACLDRFILETGLSEGIGDYWSAKWLTFFSKSGARILQVTPEMEPHFWINNHEWYRDFHPRFVIINFFSSSRIHPEEVRSLGQPSRIHSCSGFEIWVYPDGVIRLKDPTPPKHRNFQEFRS